ncbi:peptidase [Arenimonas sp. MALMAid1274]|uniref:peptidase n=1 Tax=Arenimonas sp. MALMAid1274 TaxID=3411630 RepID=UPI003BA3778D
MTYCVGLRLDQGLVMLADTRTNAGFDNISCFSKLHRFHRPGDRMIAILSAGNLAVSQAVLTLVRDGLTDPETGGVESLLTVPTMFRAAGLVSEAVRHVHHIHGDGMKLQGVDFDVSFLVGGQIAGGELALFQVYSAGNFIQATTDTAFLQIGEHKYGKPILDRAITPETSLVDATKLALISMDSTLRSNLSVGMPLDLLVYREGEVDSAVTQRIAERDPYFELVRERWSDALAKAHRDIPAPEWLGS